MDETRPAEGEAVHRQARGAAHPPIEINRRVGLYVHKIGEIVRRVIFPGQSGSISRRADRHGSSAGGTALGDTVPDS